jgi:hypothetical protein
MYWEHLFKLDRRQDPRVSSEDAYADRCGSFVLVEIDFCDFVSSKKVEIVSCLGNRAVIAIRSSRTRLVDSFQRDWAVEDAVRITSVRLRLNGQPNTLPAFEEAVCEW